MNKFTLCTLALLAALATTLLCVQDAQAVGLDQLDGLKATFLPPEYRNANFSIDDLKKVYREKCKKAAGGTENATLYQEIEKSAAELSSCLATFANFSAIQVEIEAARPNGELDTVFHKYCQKAPSAERCIRDFNAKLQPCLTKEERTQNAVLMRIATALLGFLCSRGGDQIALFVAEEGPECLQANKEAISNCMNHSFAEYLPKDGSIPDVYNLPELVLAPKNCIDLEHFEACTIHHLEQCRQITPANVVESIFRFVKNETSCGQHIEALTNQKSVLKPKGDGAASLLFSAFALLTLTALLSMGQF